MPIHNTTLFFLYTVGIFVWFLFPINSWHYCRILFLMYSWHYYYCIIVCILDLE